MQRTDLMDTSPEAWRRLVERLRQLTPEERLRITFERCEEARQFRRRTEHLRNFGRK